MSSPLAPGDDPAALSWGLGRRGLVAYGIAIAFSAFQLWTAAYSPLPSQIVRAVHVGFLLLLTFVLLSNLRGDRDRRIWLDWALGIVAFAVGLYHWAFYQALILRAGEPTTTDIIVGVLAVALVLEAARRLMGASLPIICALFLAYALFGQHLPSPLNHRGYDFSQVVDQMFLGTEGIYGIATYVSSSFIFLFILFGSFLEHAGMISLFNNIVVGLRRSQRVEGPAKVAVISSGDDGDDFNGSAAWRTCVTVGQFTIPLMKRFGYHVRYFAGAVEATASMGGQIMPPVMGAVAFIMAETLNVEYAESSCKAAIIPALLYYLTAFCMVHLEAGKKRPARSCRSRPVSRTRWQAIAFASGT